MNLNRSLVFGLLLLLGASPAAHAGKITIDFDLSASTVSIPAIPVPVTGGFQAASAIVRVPGDGISTPLPGPATLRSFEWLYTFSAVVTAQGFTANLTGFASLLQLEEAVGSLTAGLGKLVFDQPVRGSFAVYVGCAPQFVCDLACQYFGYCFPVSDSGTGSDTPGTFGVGNLSQYGLASITKTASYPPYLAVDVVGNEVDRSFAPEPSRALLSFGGIVAVVGLSLCRRLRRQRKL